MIRLLTDLGGHICFITASFFNLQKQKRYETSRNKWANCKS